eukprot:362265-Chlamydomonas_euryale.AAC.18
MEHLRHAPRCAAAGRHQGVEQAGGFQGRRRRPASERPWAGGSAGKGKGTPGSDGRYVLPPG